MHSAIHTACVGALAVALGIGAAAAGTGMASADTDVASVKSQAKYATKPKSSSAVRISVSPKPRTLVYSPVGGLDPSQIGSVKLKPSGSLPAPVQGAPGYWKPPPVYPHDVKSAGQYVPELPEAPAREIAPSKPAGLPAGL